MGKNMVQVIGNNIKLMINMKDNIKIIKDKEEVSTGGVMEIFIMESLKMI